MLRLTRRDLLKTCAAGLAAPTVWTASRTLAWAADDPYADAVFADGEPPLPQDGSFTLAVLPDTQHYSEKHPDTFLAQTQWIVDQRERRRIAAVLHLGDITNHSTPREWRNAARALGQLDGHVPYFLSLGNHDYSDGGACRDRSTLFNEYFPLAKFQGTPHFGGVYDREPDRFENSFHTFSAGGREFLVLCLEFGPRADVIRWANEVAARHPQREAILVTHAYMYYDDTRYDWAQKHKHQSWNPHAYGVAASTGNDVADGEELWQRLVSRHENFILTVNGHVLNDGLGRASDCTPGGRGVNQVLVNFQMKPHGGDGWLRLIELRADRASAEVFDYSPTRNQCNVSPQNRFAMTLAPPGTAPA